MAIDYLTTLRQTLPRLPQVMRNLRPTYRFPDVSFVTEGFIAAEGIEAVVWDVDGTLMSYHALDIDPRFRQQIRTLFRSSRAAHSILSNCDEARFETMKRMFPEVSLYRAYDTPGGVVFRTARGMRDSHTQEDVSAMLAKGGRQIRKPRGVLIQLAAEALHTVPANVVMVGDQYFTDIASANLGGARSLKVPTLRRDSFPRSLRLTQGLEALVYRTLYGKAA